MKSLIQLAKNKYFLVTSFFLIWISFFDQNDWLSRRSIDQQIEKLERDKVFFTEQVEILEKEEIKLKSYEAELERYAREKFYMKKEGINVFVSIY